MTEEKIARINELAHKKKSVGLSKEEAEEQKALREEFLSSIRQNIQSQMDNIDMVQADGSIVNLGEEHAKKNHK